MAGAKEDKAASALLVKLEMRRSAGDVYVNVHQCAYVASSVYISGMHTQVQTHVKRIAMQRWQAAAAAGRRARDDASREADWIQVVPSTSSIVI